MFFFIHTNTWANRGEKTWVDIMLDITSFRWFSHGCNSDTLSW